MSIESLRATLAGKVRDTFDNGTVIRWMSEGAAGPYLYAALKTPVGWYTTARSGNSFVPQVLRYAELLDILAESEVTDVAVSTEWQSVDA